ncbi:hypothetical protein FZ103_18290 [Streptomonospora sp. PA3]|uniref:hypothetical protein n=1 Tax=Streptomonospora sp. PA3 TaxID=2607326 RepID=UPI0012DECB38|nr:hypothetical protein [Streptomonospora sp. PA3]MUL43091.1 hypothetical protein [Streptomonospora sp. PA3]
MAYRNLAYELAVLNGLRVRLEWHGLDAVLIESVTGLRVSVPGTGEAVWITADSRGRVLLWNGDFLLSSAWASADEAPEIARTARAHLPSEKARTHG